MPESQSIYGYFQQPAEERPKRKRGAARSISGSTRSATSPHSLTAIEEKDGDVYTRTSEVPSEEDEGSTTPSDSAAESKWGKSNFEDTSVSGDKSIDLELQTDKRGLPLYPQPLSDDADPLNWKLSRKLAILAEVSALSFHSQFTGFSISPALWTLRKLFHIKLKYIAFVIGFYILLLGLSPFLWNPLAQSYGRRPLYIIGLLGCIGTAIGSALSSEYTTLLIFRTLNGFFAGVPIGLGSVVVCDLFFQHERGFYMGIYLVVQITGANVGPLVGGYLHRSLNWRWCFWSSAILALILLIILLVSVPETLYSRTVESTRRPVMSLYQEEMLKKRRREGRRIKLGAFIRPFRMLKYPSVALPSLFYAVSAGYGSIIFFFTSALAFHRVYKMQAWQIGLLLGVPTLVGTLIGEAGAGGFSDWVAERRAIKRSGRRRVAEDRLLAMLPGVILAPLGLILEGYCIQNKIHWIGPGLSIGIASAGLQIVTTVVYSYTADCYPRQVSETATMLNFGRMAFSFSVGFYAVRFAIGLGIQNAWLMFGGIELACFLPVVALMVKGGQWRERLGEPGWNLDL